MMLAAYFHTFDPVLVNLGPVAIRWYGLSYILAFVSGYIVLTWLARRGRIEMPAHRVPDAMMYLILGVLIGGRLGYGLVYDRSLLTTFRPSFPWWDLLAIHRGGMASHGGMVGVIVATMLVARGWKREGGEGREGRTTWMHLIDIMALCAPIGFFFGRLANFINGELLGAIVSPPGKPGPWWSVMYPQELLGWTGPGKPGGHAPALTREQQGTLNALVQANRGPDESWVRGLERLVAKAEQYRPQLETILSSRHPTQIYAALAEGLIVGLIVWWVYRRPRKEGVAGAWWLISYGVARIVMEIWRLPDVGFADGRPGGLSRGQWLSLVMVVAGAASLVWVTRRAGRVYPGWGRGEARGTETPAP